MEIHENQSGLSSLIEQVDSLILQHLNYLNNIEHACKKREQFVHKQPTDCNFGKLFYREVWPMKESFPEDLRSAIAEIEQEHQQFHVTGAKVDTVNPKQDEVDATSACKLILKLYALESLVKQKAL
jgi:hypothetical protein